MVVFVFAHGSISIGGGFRRANLMNHAYVKSALPVMALVLLCLGVASPAPARSSDLRLYVLDCGHATFKDMGGFSDTR